MSRSEDVIEQLKEEEEKKYINVAARAVRQESEPTPQQVKNTYMRGQGHT